MEIFFYWCGARVHFEEVGGLLCKKSGPNRYARFLAAGSRSEGQDLIKLRSNPGRWYRIGRLRAIAAYGGGGDRREQGSRGGASPDFGALVFPGSKRSGYGSARDYATCVVHLGQDLGASESEAARTWTAAALHGDSRRRAEF